MKLPSTCPQNASWDGKTMEEQNLSETGEVIVASEVGHYTGRAASSERANPVDSPSPFFRFILRHVSKCFCFARITKLCFALLPYLRISHSLVRKFREFLEYSINCGIRHSPKVSQGGYTKPRSSIETPWNQAFSRCRKVRKSKPVEQAPTPSEPDRGLRSYSISIGSLCSRLGSCNSYFPWHVKHKSCRSMRRCA